MADGDRHTETPQSVKELCSSENLEREKDNKYFLEVCKAATNNDLALKGFPASSELLANNENKLVLAAQKAVEVESALNHKTLKLSNPDSRALEKIFREGSTAEREAIAKAYATRTQRNLIDDLGSKYDRTSDQYHLLKGLLLRSDSPNSLVAVELHSHLHRIDNMSHQIEKSSEGAAGGLTRSKPGGIVAVVDLATSMIGMGARRAENKSLGTYIAEMTPSDVQEMKSEHKRMYRRDIGDMIENTKGLSKDARKAFVAKGIE